MSEKNQGGLDALRERVGRWRRRYGGRGRRLPEWIWAEAAAVAAVVGVAATARVLGLRPRRIEVAVRERAKATRSEGVTTSPFVELEGGDVEVLGGVTVEIEGRQGARVRVRGGSPETVARVAALLLGPARS